MKFLSKKTTSLILGTIGAFGVIGTAVAAVKATPKAMRALEKAENEKGEKLTKVEIVKTAAPSYIPSIFAGMSTIACIIGSQLIIKKEQAALVSAYSLLSSSFKDYRCKVNDVFGKGSDEQISAEIAKEKFETEEVYITPNDGMHLLDNGEKILFYDQMSERYFESTPLAVHNAEYHLNRNFILRGFASLNEFYEFLGLPTTSEGDTLGWTMSDGYCWLDFLYKKMTMDDGLECCIISPIFEPCPGFEDL